MEKLPELCSIQYGYAFDSACFTEDHAYLPLVRIRDVKRGYSETFYSGAYPSDYVIDNGSLLVGMDGEFNIARWKGGKALLNQRVCKITAREHVSEEYIRFALTKALKEIENRTAFVTVKHLSAKELNRLEIDIPDYETQIEISETLLRLENVISIRQQQLQKLDELVKARFVEMFGLPVSNPFSWEKRTLKEVCLKLNDGTHFSPESYEVGEYKYVTAKNIKLSGFDFSSITYVPENVHRPIYERCNPEFEDVLYIKDGATTGVAMVNSLDEEFTLLSSVALLKQDRSIMNGYFLAALLNTEEMYMSIRNNMGGAAITRLTIAKLNAIQVIVPPVELQNQFAEFVKQTNKSKAAIQKALDEAQLLFDSLMQKYFE